MSKIKIILPTNSWKGGLQQAASTLAVSFLKNGWEVTISYPILPYFWSYWTKKKILPLILFWFGQIRSYFNNSDFKFAEMFDENDKITIEKHIFYDNIKTFESYDIILFYTEYQIKEIGLNTKHENIVFYFLHPLELSHGNRDFFRDLIKIYNGKIIALSEFSNKYLSDIIKKSLPVLYPALNPVFYLSSKRTLNNKEGDFLFNYIPSKYKGFDLCVKFIEILQKEYTHCKIGFFMSIVDSTNELKKKYPSAEFFYNLSNTELKEMYGKYKFFVYPSRLEGFGIPPLEAITCGTIPVVMDVGGIDSYAKNGINAIFFEEDSIELVVKQCMEIIQNPEKLQRFQNACLKTDIEQFNPYTYSQRFLEKIRYETQHET